MANYTYAQLEQLWINNGGSSATAPLAAAIAEAESSGNAAATSSNPDGGINVGLWQLDTPGGGGAGYTASQLANPNTNAAVAVKVSKNGSDWNTWATYVSGAYKAFLSPGTTPDPSVPAAGGGTAAGSGATLDAASSSACLVVFPSVDLVVTSVGGGCLLTKAEARGMIGAGLICAGLAIGLIGAVIIAAAAFEHSGAGRAVTWAAGAVGVAAVL